MGADTGTPGHEQPQGVGRTAPPAGTYIDPDDSETMRYWDGSAWEGSPEPSRAAAPVASPNPQARRKGSGAHAPGPRRFQRVAVVVIPLLIVAALVLALALGRSMNNGGNGQTLQAPNSTVLRSPIARSGSQTGISSPPPTAAPLAPSQEAALLNQLVSRYGTTAITSGVVTTQTGALAAVAYNSSSDPSGSGNVSHLGVFQLTGSSWTKVADLTLDGSTEIDPGVPTPLVPIHLTGSALPDFAVTISQGASHLIGVVASAIGGAWHLLTLQGVTGPADAIADPKVQPNGIVGQQNTCIPNCAAGNTIDTVWTYSPQSGNLVSTVTDPLGYTDPVAVLKEIALFDVQQSPQAASVSTSGMAADCPVQGALTSGLTLVCTVTSPSADNVLVPVRIDDPVGPKVEFDLIFGAPDCRRAPWVLAALQAAGDTCNPNL